MDIANCIICGSSDNLNTEMTITVESGKVVIKLCDEHAEDTTPKIAKQAYEKRLLDIEVIMAQARQLGLVLAPSSSKLTIVQQVVQPVSPSVPQPQQKSAIEPGLRRDGVLSTEEVDRAMLRVGSVNGQIGSGMMAEGHAAYNIDQSAPKEIKEARKGTVQMNVAEGRQGQPIAIPAIRQDGLGTTTIHIARSETDATLQRRFKDASEASIRSESGVSFGERYRASDCTFCSGVGQITVGKGRVEICPRCKGSCVQPEM